MAVAFSRTTPKHWVYLDEHRSHELHAQVAFAGEEGYLVTTEFPPGSREPAEMVRAQTPVRGEAELVHLLQELEQRLALTGRYFRTDADALQWAPLATPAPTVDLRAHEAPIPGLEATGGKMRIHHFHGGSGDDRLLIDMPRPGMSGRHVLAELAFEFPRVDQGALTILHTRLAPSLVASAVAKHHVEAPRLGFSKLVDGRDYERAYGEGWFEKTRAMLSRATARVLGGPTPAPEPIVEEAPHALKPHERLDLIRQALMSDDIAGIKATYVDAVTEAILVDGGEHAIRRYVAGIRRKVSHQRAYELSLLEAALLCEYAIPSKMWDLANDEGAKLLRFVYGAYDAA